MLLSCFCQSAWALFPNRKYNVLFKVLRDVFGIFTHTADAKWCDIQYSDRISMLLSFLTTCLCCDVTLVC